MAAILHPIQCAIGPNDEAKRIVESRMAGEVAVGCQSLNTCSRQRGDSARRCRWLKKRCGYRRRCKLYKLSASRLGFHSGIFYTPQRRTKTQKNARPVELNITGKGKPCEESIGNMAYNDSMVEVPRELLWDHAEAPDDLLWRLQRIADFFPAFGKDYETVRELHRRRDELRLDAPTRLLIEEYHRAWQAKKTSTRR